MSDATVRGFVYGEHLDGLPPRSLGYRLLAPAAPEPWSAEVEALARALHATTYPDPWPPAELFCSVLLADGQRVVAVARYGLADHTASRRRGGLELVGVVCPAGVGVASALAVYRWLRRRRGEADDVASLAGTFTLREVIDAAPPPPPAEPARVLPVRLWHAGAFLFAATSPSDPDARLGLLEDQDSPAWQWVPLCGVEFPVQTYAQRGPLVAWTPNLTDLALRLDGRPAPAPDPLRPRGRFVPLLLTFFLIGLLGANLYALWTLPERLPADKVPPEPRTAVQAQQPAPQVDPHRSREDFAAALYRLLAVGKTASAEDRHLQDQYRRLVERDPALEVEGRKGRAAVALAGALARQDPDRLAKLIQEELTDQEFLRLLIDRVRARLIKEGAREP